ncbi:hypothetical protein [Chryseobacterium sp.]|uniref:hypothetical protein n=1 Tax=Chryseobacterium sp. TaxID=1871047 RepID=UPI00321A3294
MYNVRQKLNNLTVLEFSLLWEKLKTGKFSILFELIEKKIVKSSMNFEVFLKYLEKSPKIKYLTQKITKVKPYNFKKNQSIRFFKKILTVDKQDKIVKFKKLEKINSISTLH